jgi:hypothetical protein
MVQAGGHLSLLTKLEAVKKIIYIHHKVTKNFKNKEAITLTTFVAFRFETTDLHN